MPALIPQKQRERNWYDPLWRVTLLEPDGRMYQGDKYHFSTDVKANADGEFNAPSPPSPRRPPFPTPWPGPVVGVVMLTWNFEETCWQEIKRRPARSGEFENIYEEVVR